MEYCKLLKMCLVALLDKTWNNIFLASGAETENGLWPQFYWMVEEHTLDWVGVHSILYL